MTKLDTRTKAYMAGFFDGEGTVGLYKERVKRKTGYGYRWRAYVMIGQRPSLRARKMLQEFGDHYGVRTYTVGGMLRLSIRKREHLKQVIEDLLPFTKLKSVELLLLRSWLEEGGYSLRISQTLKSLKTRGEHYGY